MKKSIGKILFEAAAIKKKEDQIAFLRANYNYSLGVILNGAINPAIEWDLPTGDVPYAESKVDEPGVLYNEIRRLYIFSKGGNPNLKPLRRQQLFIDLLEHVNPEDAKILCLMKDKKLPAGLKAKTVQEAFPNFRFGIE